MDFAELRNQLPSVLVRRLTSQSIWSGPQRGTMEEATMITLRIMCEILKREGNGFGDYEEFVSQNRSILTIIHLTNPLDALEILGKITSSWGLLEIIINRAQATQSDEHENRRRLRQLWLNKGYLIQSMSKIKMVGLSPFFFKLYTFCVGLIYFISKKLYFLPPIERKRVVNHSRLLLLGRLINKLLNYGFQYDPLLERVYLISPPGETHARDVNGLVNKIYELSTLVLPDSKFIVHMKSFTLSYGSNIIQIEHMQWKEKNLCIQKKIWKLVGVTQPAILENALESKRSEVDFLEKLRYLNVRGWVQTILDAVIAGTTNITTSEQSICMLGIITFWMKKYTGIANWEHLFTVLLIGTSYSTLNKNGLTSYPRLIELTRGSWGVLYKGEIVQGTFLESCVYWCRVIKIDFKNKLPKSAAEINTVAIEQFVNFTPARSRVKYTVVTEGDNHDDLFLFDDQLTDPAQPMSDEEDEEDGNIDDDDDDDNDGFNSIQNLLKPM